MTAEALSPPLDETRAESIASVERALKIIEWLADMPEGLSFSEIVERLGGVNKAIAFKLLNTLEACGYVFHDDRTANYCLTLRVSNLALRKLSGARLLEQSRAILLPLADHTGELVRLAVVEDIAPLPRLTWVLSLLPRRQVLQIDPHYSLEIGLHTHAAGKAWLATLPLEQALKLVKAKRFKAMTPHSIVTPEAFRKELKRTGAQGYAVSFEEHAVGVSAIGVPVFAQRLDGTRACVGVVTVAAPTARRSRDDLLSWVPAVKAAAARLGGSWPQEPTGPLTPIST
ncbi:MAG: IclR family transcriptional regulator [Betaproteobacteria bacterium]|nr:MAG: IclR family transcriptional regulator [Betaproteobacteria bacterium]